MARKERKLKRWIEPPYLVEPPYIEGYFEGCPPETGHLPIRWEAIV
jgi:hypothetical protein